MKEDPLAVLFLTLRPFNTAPQVVVTPPLHYYFFFLLLHNCYVATVTSHKYDVKMCWICHVTAVKGLFNSPKEVETHKLRTALENSERDPLVPKVCECCSEWGFPGNTAHPTLPPTDPGSTRATQRKLSRKCLIPLGRILPVFLVLLLPKGCGPLNSDSRRP